MKTPQVNLMVLKKSRRRPTPGDIFVFQVEQHPDRYYFGRVVANDTNIGGFEGVVLIYLYRSTSTSKTDIPPLRLSDLPVPPIGTNDRPWMRGYFENVRSGTNATEDILAQHCFYDDFSRGYLDQYGNKLEGPIEPVGFYGLSGIGAIDQKISTALGLPLKDNI